MVAAYGTSRKPAGRRGTLALSGLHRLERYGYIEAEWQTTVTGRRARVYKLTRDGKRRLKDLERSWTALAAGVRGVLDFA